MTEENCVAIEIVKEIPLFGEGDSLESRLRKVSLKGFPNVKIYQNAEFEDVFLTPQGIQDSLFTPQPSVFQTHMDRISQLSALFREKGIDLLNLTKAYDYIATSASGVRTNWTMLPPIVERWAIPRNQDGSLNYEPLLGEALRLTMKQNNWALNADVSKIVHPSSIDSFDIINDGAHRIHYGLLNGGIKILRIKGVTAGFPYYAAPQHYSAIRTFPIRDEKAIELKIHILQAPGHKNLYRLFPSGGILSGDVRPEKVNR